MFTGTKNRVFQLYVSGPDSKRVDLAAVSKPAPVARNGEGADPFPDPRLIVPLRDGALGLSPRKNQSHVRNKDLPMNLIF
jgi:hypothetical protein